jgi:enoyl-CoA hydratase
VLDVARRITQMPPDMVQLNKRVVHRQMQTKGPHPGNRARSALRAPRAHPKSMPAIQKTTAEKGLKGALPERDEPFGDSRTSEKS